MVKAINFLWEVVSSNLDARLLFILTAPWQREIQHEEDNILVKIWTHDPLPKEYISVTNSPSIKQNIFIHQISTITLRQLSKLRDLCSYLLSPWHSREVKNPNS
jgi:hypothetical protein